MTETINLKQEFYQWLVKQDHPMLNKLGLESMVDKLDENLSISNCSDLEHKLMDKIVELFKEEKQGADERAISDSLNQYINMLF